MVFSSESFNKNESLFKLMLKRG